MPCVDLPRVDYTTIGALPYMSVGQRVLVYLIVDV